MTRTAIIQSSYIPWKGYFDIVHRADVFVFLEDVQYTVRDWRNRNRIKQPDGSTRWLSVPVLGGRDQLLCAARIDRASRWERKHLEALRHSYGKAPHFDRYFPELRAIYESGHALLSGLNRELTEKIAGWLGIATRFVNSVDLGCGGGRDDKLLALLAAVGGDHYVSGPSARSYIDAEKFRRAGIGLEYQDYSRYPPYPQIAGPFEHRVSVLDLLFMTGPEAPRYIWSVGGEEEAR
jgi:WbqC-like protein